MRINGEYSKWVGIVCLIIGKSVGSLFAILCFSFFLSFSFWSQSISFSMIL